MNKGTPVHAARGGKVIALKKDSRLGGNNKKYLKSANFIKIKHSDQTIGFYAHLKHEGVLVKLGELVKTGQQIGLAGCTGFCDGSHLHFEVHQLLKGKRHTIPISFLTNKGIIQDLKRQKSLSSDLRSKKLSMKSMVLANWFS